jgi:hypothetical protein
MLTMAWGASRFVGNINHSDWVFSISLYGQSESRKPESGSIDSQYTNDEISKTRRTRIFGLPQALFVQHDGHRKLKTPVRNQSESCNRLPARSRQIYQNETKSIWRIDGHLKSV